MSKAVCKFQVMSIEPGYNDGEESITMGTVYDENDPEDTKFSKATPWGEMKFGLSNPRLVGEFKVGQIYHVHLVPIEEDPARGRFV